MFENIMNIKDFALAMKTNESTVRTWIRRGELPSFLTKKIGGRVFINSDKFKEWFDKDE